VPQRGFGNRRLSTGRRRSISDAPANAGRCADVCVGPPVARDVKSRSDVRAWTPGTRAPPGHVCTVLRRGSIPVAAGATGVACFPPPRNPEELVRAEGVEPSRAFAGPTDFRATSAFAAALGVRGLDYPFDLPRIARGLAAARLVSTPSRRKRSRPGLARDRHFRVPRLWAVLHRRFPGEHSSSPQVRCVCQFRHTRVADHSLLFMIGQPQALGCPNCRHPRPGS
jgi:hypothetical protein